MIGDFVKVILNPYAGMYTAIKDNDEIEIQYFENKFGKWVLAEADVDNGGKHTFSK